MDQFFKEFAEDFVAIAVDASKGELGIRIGAPLLRYGFDKLPEYSIKNTKYNRQNLKWFRFEGIDVSRREIKFYSRLRIMKFTDKVWPLSGTWTVFDNAWDVHAGLNLEVQGREIKADVHIHEILSDWPDGLAGIFLTAFDAFVGSISWLLTGKFATISDAVMAIGASIFNLNDAGNISSYLKEVDNLNQRGLIFLQKTDYDNKGFWTWYTIDPSKLGEVLPRIEAELRKRGWL